MAFFTDWLAKIGSAMSGATPGTTGVVLSKSDESPDLWKSDDAGAAKVSVVNYGVAGTHVAAVTVSSPGAGALGAAGVLTPRGIKVWSPDGTGASTANTDAIGVGYAGLTAANCVDWLLPGDFAIIPCANLSEVLALSATAAQTLRVEVL